MKLVRTTRLPRVPRGPLLAVGAFLLLIALNEAAGWWTGRGGAVLCTLRRVTGYPCPGCGSTRMVRALLGGSISQAAALNPLFFVLVVGGGALLLFRAISGHKVEWSLTNRSRRMLAIALITAVAANWIYLIVRGIQARP